MDQQVANFQILVGPNGSGKSTFLQTVGFLGELVRNKDGIEGALQEFVPSLQDLTWMRRNNWFELAVETSVPEHVARKFKNDPPTHLRYEVRVAINEQRGEIALENETLWMMRIVDSPPRRPMVQRTLFPEELAMPETILWERTQSQPEGARKIVNRLPTGNVYYGWETGAKRNKLTIRLRPLRSALANLPADEENFPAGNWFRTLLMDGVQQLSLNSATLRKPSPPGTPRRFRSDGSNLPLVIEDFKKEQSEDFQDWLQHLRTAIPDIEDVRTVERDEDKHRYLVVKFSSGLEAPSWLVSDGTLRLLALTIVAYHRDIAGVFLIEEPENGIHPRAVETVFQSLASSYRTQIFLASHSPVILGSSGLEQVLIFARTASGATDIVRGPDHPRLKDWRRSTNLGTLFASGVLG